MSWTVTLSSEEYGHESFNYASRREALETLDRLTLEAEEHYAKDGIRRGVVLTHVMDMNDIGPNPQGERTKRTKRKEKNHE